MRRNKQSGFVTRILETACSLNRDSALAICTSHMHGLEIVLGISEVMSKIPHLVYVGLLSGAKLPIHVPIEYSPQAIDIYRLYCL